MEATLLHRRDSSLLLGCSFPGPFAGASVRAVRHDAHRGLRRASYLVRWLGLEDAVRVTYAATAPQITKLCWHKLE
ncbi:hypothetical protein EJB05_27909, partial [Eragrostis curvula]